MANKKKLAVTLRPTVKKRPIRTQKKVLLIWFLGAFFLLYQFFLQIAPSVMIDPLAESFKTNALGISLMSSAYFYTYIALQIPAGILVDKGNVRYIYAVSLALLSLTCICFALSQSFANSIILRIMMGIFASPGLVSAFYLVNRWFLKKYFALFLGLTEMYCMLGSAIGQVLLAQGVIFIGWRNSMIVYGVIGLLVAGLSYIIIKERKTTDASEISFKVHRILWRQIKTENPDKPNPPSHFKQHFKRLMTMPEVWIAGIVCGIPFSILSAFAGFWCIPLLQTNFNLSLSHASMASAVILLGGAACTPLAGILVEKLKNIERWMAMGLFLAALLFLPFILFAHIPISLMICILVLLGMLSAVYVAPFALVKNMVPNEISSTAMGMVNILCIIIGAPLLVPLVGVAIRTSQHFGLSESGGFQAGLSLFPILLVAAAIMSLWLAKKKPKKSNINPKSIQAKIKQTA